MSKFEDNLWADLKREHAAELLQNMTKLRSRRTARWIGAAAAVAVLGTGALAASTYFGGAPPAYAVVDNPDGSVTLTVHELEAFDAATTELRKRGIRAFAVPMRKDCSWDEYAKIEPIQLLDQDQISAVEWNMSNIYQMKIHRERIPTDAELVIFAIKRGRGLQIGAGYARGQMPKCIPIQGS